MSDSAVRVRFEAAGRTAAAAVADEARAAGLTGWVREGEAPGELRAHLEGAAATLDAVLARLAPVVVEPVRAEGHEQMAVRGVPAGAFVVQHHAASSRHFDLRLEVDEVMRSWALPKGPSMDPAVKRLAVAVDDHALDPDGVEGRVGEGATIVWDRGLYEQGGRVPWPEALERGHAVFVLHGEKLRGGFALQRTARGWLLVKRRDEHARPGSDVVADQPAPVRSGHTLEQMLAATRLGVRRRRPTGGSFA